MDETCQKESNLDAREFFYLVLEIEGEEATDLWPPRITPYTYYSTSDWTPVTPEPDFKHHDATESDDPVRFVRGSGGLVRSESSPEAMYKVLGRGKGLRKRKRRKIIPYARDNLSGSFQNLLQVRQDRQQQQPQQQQQQNTFGINVSETESIFSRDKKNLYRKGEIFWRYKK